MTIESSLYAALAALAAGRVYPLLRPQGTGLPAVVYQRVSTVPTLALTGNTGLDAVRLQIASWGASYQDARELAQDVRAALLAETGLKVVLEMELDDYDEGAGEYRVIQDYRVWQRA